MSCYKPCYAIVAQIDETCSKHRELLFYSIISFWTVLLTLFSFIVAYGTEIPDSFFIRTGEGDVTLLAPGYWHGSSLLGGYSPHDFVIMAGSVYLAQGISFVWVCIFEIGNGGALRNADLRIDLVGRIYAHVSFVLPGAALLSMTNDLASMAKFIQVVFFLQLYPIISSVVMVASTAIGPGTPWFARPSLGAILIFLLGITTLATQFFVVGLTSTRQLYDLNQALLYTLGAVYILVSFRYVFELARGRKITGRGYDIIILVWVVVVWGVAFRATRGGITFRDQTFSIDNWFNFRLCGGCAFLLLWQLRSTHVFLRRVETEEKREAAITAEVALKEKQVALQLLHVMVPPRIATELCRGVAVAPELHPFSTVFFSDIEGFTRFSSVKQPLEVFAMLKRLFRVMDYCVSLFPRHLYKVEAVGDAFMVVGGLPPSEVADFRDNDEAQWRQAVINATCEFAMLIREAVQLVPLDEVSFVKMRIGVHTGSIVTGLNGTIVPRFSCFGDTVNVAARMETTGESNRVHVSGAFADMVKNTDYSLESRDTVEVKGKGRMQTYWLDAANLEDFRRKRAATLSVVEDMLRSSISGGEQNEQFMLSSHGTINLPALQQQQQQQQQQQEGGPSHSDPLASVATSTKAAEEDGDARHIALELGVENLGVDESSSSIGTAPVIPSPPASTPTLAPEGCGFTFAELTAADFNPLAIEENQFERICQAILCLFEGIVASPGCVSVTDPETLVRLVRRVGASYRCVPYHSFWHSFCVVQQTAHLLILLGLGLDGDDDDDAFFSERERFQLMLSALCHDIDHPGHSSQFEVASKSSLALLYNDQSVLEMHHLALCFNIMQHRSYCVFSKWDAEAAAQARKFIIACVLATDMDAHRSLQDDLRRRAERSQDPDQAPPAFVRADKVDRLLLAKCLLHAADIANPTRPFHISARISLLAIREFELQAQEEAKAGLPVSPHMVYADDAAKCRAHRGIITTLDENVRLWKKHAADTSTGISLDSLLS